MILQTLTRELFIPLKEFIFPPLCFACDRPVKSGNSKICAECWNSLESVDPSHDTWLEIQQRLDEQQVISDLCSCFLFEKEGRMQDIMHHLKYRGVKSIGRELGRRIGERHAAFFREIGAQVCIPMPLHKLKARERGYNQCDLICRGIADISRITVRTDILRREKFTLTQTKLGIDERRANVANAFSVDPASVAALKSVVVLLVDDVITTGSTMNSAAAELLAAGADRVVAVSAALAV